MNPGPPLWLHPPAIVTSASHNVDDARVHLEIWAAGMRIHAAGYAEDDAAWIHEPWTTCFPLESAICLCNTLATGKDTHHEQQAWGRVYRTIYSLDSHTSQTESDPARQEVWFYPMTERRTAFRMVVGPLVSTLTLLFQWAYGEAPAMQADVQGAQRHLLHRGLSLLDDAARRIRGPGRE